VQAVLQLNLCRVLQAPTGEHMRPLVVRRTNMRKPASSLMLLNMLLLLLTSTTKRCQTPAAILRAAAAAAAAAVFAQAVLQLNLCRVLQDPTGEQTRPLVVRRANMHTSAFSLYH
jgi:hypothetical protein